jgi:hypothetical protein
MVSIDGATLVMGANAHIVQTYSPTWPNACVWCNCLDGGGIGSFSFFLNLKEANVCALMYAPFVMFPSYLSCINTNNSEYIGGLSHHPMVEMTNTKNGRTKMHAKLLCQMDQRATKLKGYIKYVNPWHINHMEYDYMSEGVVNQDGKNY